MSETTHGGRHVVKRLGLVVAGLLVICGCFLYGQLAPGARFLTRYMDKESPQAVTIDERVVIVPTKGRDIPTRLFIPASGYHRVVLVAHGVHWKGFDEPRLLHFARALATMGYAVAAPDLKDLKNYQLEPEAVDEIEASALWLLNDSGLELGDGKIGVMGISFAGGLSVSAASRESLADRVAFVFSFGGHGDLDRTLNYLITGEMPGGETLAPHVYGQAVVIRFFADRLVPRDQVEPLRSVLFDYLKDDKKKVRARLQGLAPESRRLVELCLKQNVPALGEVLKNDIGEFTTTASLSPQRGRPPRCPIFLLHGSVDNVIPPSESVLLGEWAAAETDATVLVSELIKHVDLDKGEDESSWTEYWKALRFWTELLDS